MAVTYTTAALVRKRFEHIDSSLLDVDIEQYIYEAEGTINSAMKYSLIDDFNTTDHAIIRSCATDLAAYSCLKYNPSECPSLEAAEMTANLLWNDSRLLLELLEQPRTVEYLKGTESTTNFGTEAIFNSVDTDDVSSAVLDSTHIVVAYRDEGGAGYGYGYARIGVISGNGITYGAKHAFNSASTYYVSVAALDTTHFVIAYMDAGNSYYGTAIVGEVTGTTITSYGAEHVFNSAWTSYASVAALDSTHFIIVYSDIGNSYFGTAIVGLVTGTTITSYGAENVLSASATYYTAVVALDSTHFAVAYQDYGGSNRGIAIVGLVTGTTITSYGSAKIFNETETTYVSVAALDSTHFIIVYSDIGNSGYGTAIVGEVTGTTITSYGAKNSFNTATTYYIAVAALDSTHVVIAYRDAGNSNYGTATIGTVTGTTITSYDIKHVFNEAQTDDITVEKLSSSKYVVNYNTIEAVSDGRSRVWMHEITYTTAALVRKRFEHIDSSLLDADIEQYIYEAEGTIDAAMKYSFLATFDTDHHQILRSCATTIAAHSCLRYNPSKYSSLEAAEMTANLLWNDIRTLLGLLGDQKTVSYLKSLV